MSHWIVRQRAFGRALTRGGLLLAGAATVLLANDTLERASLGRRRFEQAGLPAPPPPPERLWGRGSVRRSPRAIGLNRFEPDLDFLLGGLIVALVAFGAWRLTRPDRYSRVVGGVAFVAVACFYLVRFDGSLGFRSWGLDRGGALCCGGCVYRLEACTPVSHRDRLGGLAAGVGVSVHGWGRAAMGWPLSSSCRVLCLVVAGVVSLGRTSSSARRRAWVLIVRDGIGGDMAVGTVPWRRHGLRWFGHDSPRDDEAIISAEPHNFREGGVFYTPGAHWLTATTDRQFREAVRIVRNVGDQERVCAVPRERRPLMLSKDSIEEEPGVWLFSEEERAEGCDVPAHVITVIRTHPERSNGRIKEREPPGRALRSMPGRR